MPRNCELSWEARRQKLGDLEAVDALAQSRLWAHPVWKAGARNPRMAVQRGLAGISKDVVKGCFKRPFTTIGQARSVFEVLGHLLCEILPPFAATARVT